MADSKERKGLISVIKFEGDNELIVWKHSIEDFSFGSQLIVHETQEAIFFRDGKALDSFGSGRYTLETPNLPILNSLYKLPTGGIQPFHSEVYFINLVTQLGIKWGTDSKIRFFDPISGLHLQIGAHGTFNLKVKAPRQLLLTVVGTTNSLTQESSEENNWSKNNFVAKFKSLIVSKVKSNLAKMIRENDINILEIDEYLETLALTLKNEINLVLDDYGFVMPEFFITEIVTPDDHPDFVRLKKQHAEQYLRVRQARIEAQVATEERGAIVTREETEAQRKKIEASGTAGVQVTMAEAKAKEMELIGYTYEQETQRMVAIKAVSSEHGVSEGHAGTLIDSLVKLGVGMGVVGEVVKTVKSSLQPINPLGNQESRPNDSTGDES